MHIGVCCLKMHLPDANNLKAKRGLALSLVARLRRQFNVAVAEVDDNELWQRLTLGVCCVSNDSSHANDIISNVVSFVESSRNDIVLLDYESEVISGV